MAFRKKSTFMRKRKSTKRNMFGKFTKRVSSRNQIHRFKRQATVAVIIGNATNSDQYGSAYYSLALVQNPTEFTNLFDHYKINAVKTTFIYEGPQAPLTVNGLANPTLYTLVDTNDATVPTSINGLLENAKTRVHSFNTGRTVVSCYFKPRTLTMLWNQVAATSQPAGSSPSQWLDVVHSNIAHFGLKYAIAGLQQNCDVQILTTYYLSFKDSR